MRLDPGRALRARTLLAIFTAIPVGLGLLLGFWQIRESQDRAQVAAEIEEQAAELVALSEFSGALVSERNWNSAWEVTAGAGLNSQTVRQVTGLDLDGHRSEAMETVDQLSQRVDLAEFTERLARIRSLATMNGGVSTAPDLAGATEQYDELAFELATETDRLLDELIRSAGSAAGADQLLVNLRVLQLASQSSRSIADQTTAYFGTQFGFVQPLNRGTQEFSGSEDYLIMIEKDAARRAARDEMLRVADPTSRAYSQLILIQEQPNIVRFQEAIQALARERLAQGEAVGAVELSVLFADLEGLVDVFRAWHIDLVSEAGVDLRGAAQDLRTSASEEVVTITLVTAAAMIGGVLTLAVATIGISRPLRLLAIGADRLRQGTTDRHIRPLGSLETRQAALALNDAATSIEVFQDHATAIARGEIPDLESGTTPDGPLGVSVESAVRTLSTSLEEQQSLRTRLAHEASHDSLTRIANRRASVEHLKAVLRAAVPATSTVGVLFVDLDGFKSVNDNLGHRAGDIVLKETAQRLRRGLRGEGHIGRLGGDEFIVVLDGETAATCAGEVAHRLIAALNEPIALDVATVSVRASIGIAMDDRPGSTAESLLHEADIAVYEAKRHGPGAIQRFDDRLRALTERQSKLTTEIRRALDLGEFELWAQPLIQAQTGELTGFEALLRWNHPERGLTSPAGFVLFAERSDLITEIDRWVMKQAALTLCNHDAIPSLAVNISGRHLSSSSFIDDVLGPLRECSVDPQRLIVEITESAVLDDIDEGARKLEMLRSHGIRIALDDFGTGYASISHLRSLPLDIVKIDRSFIGDETRSLARLMTQTAQILGLSVTAEGVETGDQAESLTAMGIDVLQGYHFGRPAPFAEHSAMAAIAPPTFAR